MKRRSKKKNDTNPAQTEISELRVVLKPILGIPPSRYVPIGWLALIAFLFVLVAVWPGLVDRKALVFFDSIPSGAAVYVDGARVGGTPVRTFVTAGEHDVSVRHPFAAEWSERISVPGRLLFSRFVPARMTVQAELGNYRQQRAHDGAVAEYAAWSATGTPSAQFQQPWIASREALWQVETNQLVDEDILVRDFMVHAANATQIADIIRSQMIVSQGVGVSVSADLSRVVRNLIQTMDSEPVSPELAVRLASLVDEDAARSIAEKRWYTDSLDARNTRLLSASLELDESPPGPVPLTIERGDAVFVQVAGGSYIPGYPLRNSVSHGSVVDIDTFYLQRTEVSAGMFATFLAEEPYWRRDNLEALVSEQFADSHYLEGWEELSLSDPVVGVSSFAAQAFAEWFTKTYLSETGIVAKLPTASEWEYAAFVDSSGDATVNVNGSGAIQTTSGRAGALGLLNMVGNVWEWTDTWYAVNAAYFFDYVPRTGDLKVVAGGCFANLEADHTRRGVHPPEWSTPYLGFRLSLHRAEAR